MDRVRNFFLVGTTIAVAAFCFIAPASAFSITPIRGEVSMDPGSSQVVAVTIENDQNLPQTFKTYVNGIHQDAAGHPSFGQGLDEAENWVKLDSSTVVIAPRQSKQVDFTINVPANAVPGTHLIALLVEPVSSGTQSMQLTTRAATVLSITVAGVVHEEVAIQTWSLPLVTSRTTWPATLIMKNNGTVPVKLSAVATVRGWWGGEVSQQTVPMGNGFVNQSARSLSPVITAAGLWLPGPYQVDLKVTYGLSQTATAAIFSVWFIPLWVYVVVAIIIVLVIAKKIRSGRV